MVLREARGIQRGLLLDGIRHPRQQQRAEALPHRPLRRTAGCRLLTGHNGARYRPSPADEFDEVWIVVDHDGTDRVPFLQGCQEIRRSRVYGTVSIPCFEVWLNAHYGRIPRYQDQADAQRHYRELTGGEGRTAKGLPKDFPFEQAKEAARQCFLVGGSVPDVSTQGPSPSTTMPHLLRRLGLLDG